MSKKSLNISKTGFDDIKQELISFLSAKPEFQGFDFDGSNLSILIDLLSYNTYYNNYYLNMMSSEMFLDSSQLRNSVVSHAKMLGYTPSSTRGSLAKVQITINTSDDVTFIDIPKFTKFQSTIDGSTYSFVTKDSYTAERSSSDSNLFIANDVILVQGRYFQHRFTVNGDDSERFVIPNKGVDTSVIDVIVYENSLRQNGERYTQSIDEVSLDGDSKVYFLSEAENEKFEISFGDGILGKDLEIGNQIEIRYIVSEGSITDKANNFIFNDSIGYTNISVTTINPADSGSSIEDIESIRFNAPKKYQSNNRLVTARDYATLIQNRYPNFESVESWGGEDNDPPVYGKVFVSIKTSSDVALSSAVKQEILESLIKSRNIISINAEIIDPEFVYIKPNVNSIYNLSTTSKNLAEIRAEIFDVLLNYSDVQLEKFSKSFRLSSVLRLIDDIDGVINSSLEFTLTKRIIPQKNNSQSINVIFANEIYHPFDTYEGSVVSSKFTFAGFNDCYIDDFNGTLRIVRNVADSILILDENVGTVDYDKGVVSIVDFRPEDYQKEYIEITIQPKSSDVVPIRNQILQINSDDILLVLQNEDNLKSKYFN